MLEKLGQWHSLGAKTPGQIILGLELHMYPFEIWPGINRPKIVRFLA